MKEIEILADMCIETNRLLYKLYQKGEITRETYIEHIRLKLLFLRNINNISVDDEQKFQMEIL